MTATDSAERERREAIRAARYEAFCLRTIAANQAAERAAQKLCNLRLREPRRQLVLEFQI